MSDLPMSLIRRGEWTAEALTAVDGTRYPIIHTDLPCCACGEPIQSGQLYHFDHGQDPLGQPRHLGCK